MGLFGLFGSKEPKEEKQFWNAFQTAAKAHKEKNLDELIAATNAYPEPWQGYWLIGLYYDMGLGKIAVNEQKAKDYQYKAENAAKGTEDETWLNNFYYWYHQDAGSAYRNFKESTAKFRKLGIAAINTYEHNKSVINKKNKDDAQFWEKMIPASFVSASDVAQFNVLFERWSMFDYAQRDDVIKNTDEFSKDANTARKMFMTQRKLGYLDTMDKVSYDDMVQYLWGYCLLNGGPYALDLVVKNMGKTTAVHGIEHISLAALMGNIPARYHIIRLAYMDEEENYDFVSEIYKAVTGQDIFELKWEWLIPRSKEGDAEALRLCKMYDFS